MFGLYKYRYIYNKRESKLSFRLPFGGHGLPWKRLKIGPQLPPHPVEDHVVPPSPLAGRLQDLEDVRVARASLHRVKDHPDLGGLFPGRERNMNIMNVHSGPAFLKVFSCFALFQECNFYSRNKLQFRLFLAGLSEKRFSYEQ